MPEYRDRTLRCEDCGATFAFTAREQAFYQERGFSEPKRCPSCRAARKSQRSGEGRYGEGRSGRGSGSGGYERGSRRERPPRPMYDVICADCGQPTQVPFEPRDDRPVYCKECYEKHR